MKQFNNILFVYEPTSNNSASLEHAINLAESNQAHLTVLEVIEDVPYSMGKVSDIISLETLQKGVFEECEEKLKKLLESVHKGVKVITRVRTGTFFLEIIREVIQEQHDLVIKSTQDGDQRERISGSNDMHLLRKCPCPVWLMKPNKEKLHHRILAAVDCEEKNDIHTNKQLNQKILEMSASLAGSGLNELHVVHVWRVYGESSLRNGFARLPEKKLNDYIAEVRQEHHEWLKQLMDDLTKKIGKDAFDFVKPRIHLLKGNPQNEILRLVDELEIDLVVMGTVARTGIPGFFMGNTAESILNRIDQSVLAFKPEDFVTPVQ
jgi:universal stress protein E